MLQINLKKIKNTLFVLTIITFLFSAKSFAAPALQIIKTLNLSVNTSHLLTFDEKIISYKFQNEKDFKAEILSNIFNNRKELLIKPLSNVDNKLTVWTASRIYNFNIGFETVKSEIVPENNCGMEDFELDNPPKVKN